MPLVLVRVDCRLIHGQVIEAWVPYSKAQCVVVANDEAADDLLQRSIMEMAVPPTVEVAILKVRDAAHLVTAGRWSDKRVLILFADCRDAYVAFEAGLKYRNLNLGNLVCATDKTQVTCSLFFSRDDLEYLYKLRSEGVRVEARPVPLDAPVELSDLIGSRRIPIADAGAS